MTSLPWPGPWFALVVASRLVVPVCAAVVLVAVALNFLKARDAGPVDRVTRSPVATVTMLLFLAVAWAIVRFRVGVLPLASGPLAAGLSVAGAGAVIAGAIVNVLGRLELGGNWADQVTVYRTQTLVTRGVFRYVRHPLYASLIWMFCGAAFAHHNWAALAATLAVFVPAMHYRAGQEERLLEERFPGYARYRSAVPRFFPRSWRRWSDDRV